MPKKLNSSMNNGSAATLIFAKDRHHQTPAERHTERWSGRTRNWDRPEKVWLNPATKTDNSAEKLKEAA